MLEPEIAARHDDAVDQLGDFVEPSLVLLRPRIDHDIARAASALVAEQKQAIDYPSMTGTMVRPCKVS